MSHPSPAPDTATSAGIAIPDPEPDVLAARELIAEARAAVAKSRELVAIGRKLREESELIFKRFHRFHKSGLMKLRKIA